MGRIRIDNFNVDLELLVALLMYICKYMFSYYLSIMQLLSYKITQIFK